MKKSGTEANGIRQEWAADPNPRKEIHRMSLCALHPVGRGETPYGIHPDLQHGRLLSLRTRGLPRDPPALPCR